MPLHDRVAQLVVIPFSGRMLNPRSREFRNYVDGVQEGAAPLRLAPQGPGRTSVGVRINRVDYFKGAIRVARLTRGALSSAEFMKPLTIVRKSVGCVVR